MADHKAALTDSAAAPPTLDDTRLTMNKWIEIQQIMPGAAVVHADDEQILCGFPEEVAKACFAHGKQITAWLLPDVRSQGGIVQWALEFPLYVALFVQGLFAKGKKK